MSSVNSAELRAKKNCLLVFRNKKINNFDGANEIIKSFSGLGYSFDKIAYVSYTCSEAIVRELVDGRQNYENLLIYCPAEMESMLKNFVKSMYSSEFSDSGILKSSEGCVFVILSDNESKLRLDDIKNILDSRYGVRYERAYVKAVGASTRELNDAIINAINADPSKTDTIKKLIDFNVSDNYGDCSIELVYPDEMSKSTFDKVYRSLITYLDKYVYSLENFSLADRLFQLLKLRRMKISIAESFTGGGVGKSLVDVPGISEVYFEGLNTYSNDAKISRLGVDEFTLQRYGAVSEEVAREMVKGLLRDKHCDVGVATTGIAGPKSDNTSKPVGLCYIAVGTRENISVYEYKLKGDRDTITKTAINLALFLTYKTLK